MKNLFLIILLAIPLVQSSYGESLENDLTITVSVDGTARVLENLSPRVTISSINIPSISNKISNILATDEKNIILSVIQNDNDIRIDTLGASHVTLTYNANILNNTSGIWHLDYDSHIQSTVILPPESNIVSVNEIPIDIKNDTIIMPPGKVSISYTVRSVTANNFIASWNDLDYPIQIMTASKVHDFGFDQNSKSITLIVDNNAPMLVILPKSLIGGPYEVQQNENPIDFKQYYQNATHSWIRIDPSASGTIKIIGTTVVPEFFSISVLIFGISISGLIFLTISKRQFYKG